MMTPTIAFNMANLVAYYSDFQFKLSEWGKQHQLAADRTTAEEWKRICERIRDVGYDAVEVWVALVEKCEADPSLAAEFKRTLAANRLKPVALAGPLNDRNAIVCQRLGIPMTAGGWWGSDKETAARVSRATGILVNYENHPEKSVQEIREQANFGADGFAVALDTGWLGTQRVDAPKAVRELGRLIRHVHLKDVIAPGGHETCRLGDGVVDIPGVIDELKKVGYDGVLSWEDEPENRDIFEIAAEMREYIAREWSK
jgi:sugar phosphate isomerase/epimerase